MGQSNGCCAPVSAATARSLSTPLLPMQAYITSKQAGLYHRKIHTTVAVAVSSAASDSGQADHLPSGLGPSLGGTSLRQAIRMLAKHLDNAQHLDKIIVKNKLNATHNPSLWRAVIHTHTKKSNPS